MYSTNTSAHTRFLGLQCGVYVGAEFCHGGQILGDFLTNCCVETLVHGRLRQKENISKIQLNA